MTGPVTAPPPPPNALGEALRPCPFCGGPGTAHRIDREAWDAGCLDCAAVISWQPTKAEAIAAWNRRPAEPERAGLLRAEVAAETLDRVLASAGTMTRPMLIDWLRAERAALSQPAGGE